MGAGPGFSTSTCCDGGQKQPGEGQIQVPAQALGSLNTPQNRTGSACCGPSSTSRSRAAHKPDRSVRASVETAGGRPSVSLSWKVLEGGPDPGHAGCCPSRGRPSDKALERPRAPSLGVLLAEQRDYRRVPLPTNTDVPTKLTGQMQQHQQPFKACKENSAGLKWGGGIICSFGGSPIL